MEASLFQKEHPLFLEILLQQFGIHYAHFPNLSPSTGLQDPLNMGDHNLKSTLRIIVSSDFYNHPVNRGDTMIPITQVWRLIPRWMNPGVQHQSLGYLQPSEGLLPVQRSFLCSRVSAHVVQFSHSVMCDSLWSHEPQHTRPPCPSPTPGVHPNPCPLGR